MEEEKEVRRSLSSPPTFSAVVVRALPARRFYVAPIDNTNTAPGAVGQDTWLPRPARRRPYRLLLHVRPGRPTDPLLLRQPAGRPRNQIAYLGSRFRRRRLLSSTPAQLSAGYAVEKTPPKPRYLCYAAAPRHRRVVTLRVSKQSRAVGRVHPFVYNLAFEPNDF